MSTKTEEKKKGRRKNPYGEGSIYKCESGPKKGKWIGKLIIGYTPDGKKIRKTFYGTGWNEVRDKMKAVKAELDQGINIIKQKEITFETWITNWMNNYKKLEVELTTWENYDRSIKNHIIPSLGALTLKDLSTDHIQKFYSNLISKDKAPATVRRNHQIIHSALSQAVTNNLISRNPSNGVSLPKLENKEARAMSMDEMNTFLDLLLLSNIGITKIGPKWRAAFLLLIFTGLREGEILALKWTNIDLKNKTLQVKEAIARTKAKGIIFKEPKSKKAKRTIPLPKDLVVALRLHRIHQHKVKTAAGENYKNLNLVFSTSKGTLIGPRNFTRKFVALRKRAKLPEDINLHALRHTYATRLLEQGESLKTLQELLGHEDISTGGNTYAHVMPEIKKQAATKLNSLIRKKLPKTEKQEK